MVKSALECSEDEFAVLPHVRFVCALSRVFTLPPYAGHVELHDLGVLVVHWNVVRVLVPSGETFLETGLRALELILDAWLTDLKLPPEWEQPILKSVREWWGNLTEEDIRAKHTFLHTPGVQENLRPIAERMAAVAEFNFAQAARPNRAARRNSGERNSSNAQRFRH